MRDPKFRAKSIKTNKWIYGTYLHLGAGLHYIIPILHYYPISKSDYEKYQIDPETLGQSTELKDKNDVEIFEGDVVKDNLGGIGVVEWDEVAACFGYGDDIWQSRSNEEVSERSYMLEVIGNKFENPELLEVKNE